MTIDFEIEGRLKFAFDANNWNVLKWDADQAYVDGIGKIATACAIDLIAVLNRSTLYLIEVKDPRGYRIKYKRTISSGELVEIVATKVRDTIAGLPWARDRVSPSHHLTPFLNALYVQRPTRVAVVLWLEDADAAQALSLKGPIERRLTWLKPSVYILNRNLIASKPEILAGLDVTSMPGAVPTS
jgi:hypothetical protein